MSVKKDKVYDEVGNYTKFKLVERLINKHKDTTLDSLDKIETLADDVLNVLSICGMKYYQQLKGKFDEGK
jgi:hypothetical protein|tara:strand:- start:136 stop:345 length:210 start_codon:yes stop_codon:yes gene_type:complete